MGESRRDARSYSDVPWSGCGGCAGIGDRNLCDRVVGAFRGNCSGARRSVNRTINDPGDSAQPRQADSTTGASSRHCLGAAAAGSHGGTHSSGHGAATAAAQAAASHEADRYLDRRRPAGHDDGRAEATDRGAADDRAGACDHDRSQRTCVNHLHCCSDHRRLAAPHRGRGTATAADAAR
jgi:hypothetical protein